MGKFAEPQTFVFGARRRMDDRGMFQLRDKRKRLLWDMPRPIGYVTHTHAAGKSNNVEVEVPVYRGVEARVARYEKAQMRRAVKKSRDIAQILEEIIDA